MSNIHSISHITQSKEWTIFRQKTGIKSVRVDDLNLYLHPVPRLPYFVGYLPRPEKLNNSIIGELIKTGKKNNCVFIKVDPELNQLIDKLPNQLINNSKSILPQHTFFIDLTKSEEELLKAMESKTRYNIKVAQKHGVIIKQGQTSKDINEFIKILEDTENRQGFLSHPANYYRILWQTLRPSGMVYLLLAYPPINPKSKKIPIASIMLFKHRDILYYPYGGSLAESRNLMPNYLLHWEAIKLGKKLNCRIYDMWGAFRNKPESFDPWWGIYRFKSGFNGQLINYPNSFDLIISPLLYRIYQIVDIVRWQITSIKQKLFNF